MHTVGRILLEVPSIWFSVFSQRVNVRNCSLVAALPHVGLSYNLSPIRSKECPKSKLTGSCILTTQRNPAQWNTVHFIVLTTLSHPRARLGCLCLISLLCSPSCNSPAPADLGSCAIVDYLLQLISFPARIKKKGLVQYPLPKKTAIFQNHPRLV